VPRDIAVPAGLPRADVCIVGAGVAGIALALGLRDRGFRVLLLESGGVDHEPAAQDLNHGTSEDDGYPFVASRSRGLGGTSRLWYGACIPLDPADFEARDWLAHSGWPIGADALAPHYERTRALFGLPDLAPARRDIEGTPFHRKGLAAKVVAHSDPVDLGRKYRAELENSGSVQLRLGATVTALRLGPEGDLISHLEIAASNGERAHVQADKVVLACGGIENARLLLASGADVCGGIGNRHDLVGRYHMEHPMRAVGILPVGRRGQALRPFTDRGLAGGLDVIGTVGLSPEIRARHGLLDLHLRVFRFHPLEATAPVIRGKEGWRGLSYGTARSRFAALGQLGSALRPAVPRYLAWHALGKLFRRTPFDHVRFTAFLEQEPDPENRITLGKRRDRFGQPLPHLTWRESGFMRDSHRRSLQLLDTEFQTCGFGRLQHRDDEIAFLEGYHQYGLHHMGSTRMSDDPRQGVVDRDCRVHGIRNLFIAGSSVFPTGGAANPTWTIAALAARLADHLAAQRRPTAPPGLLLESKA
jgi:choline dehydrogenase-like flavoprotein